MSSTASYRFPTPRLCDTAANWRRRKEFFVGITAGGTFAGALHVCADAPKGAAILCMLPDTGERYLSTPLFADIPADMNEEEMAISRSTPSARFGA
jgi:cysteine synthase